MRKTIPAVKWILLAISLLVTSAHSAADGFPQALITAQIREAQTPAVIDLSPLEPGMVVRLKYLGLPVLVYRRTADEIKGLENPRADLADPSGENWRDSVRSHYGSSSSEVWARLLLASDRRVETSSTRSVFPEYFVFGGWSPDSGCVISIVSTPESGKTGVSFHDPCVKNDFDAAGRVLTGSMAGGRNGLPARFNLFIPPHRFTSPTTVAIGLQAGQPLPSLPDDFRPSYDHVSAQEALRLAALYNQKDIILAALNQGASPSYKAPRRSPLDAAIIGSDIEIVKLFLELGAEETPVSRDAANMLHRDHVIELLDKYAAHNQQPKPTPSRRGLP